MSEINITGFSGMNNVKETEGFASKGIAHPRINVNADVTVTGGLIKRDGITPFVTLSGAHSLWAGVSCMLCAAGGTLYRISQGAATSIGAITGPESPLFYAEVEDKVYISNPYWRGVFDPAVNTLSSWGIVLPPGPMLLAASGNLPAGKYHVTMTNVSGDEISGNGPISDITLAAEGGIEILNRPSNAIVWATEANESIFYKIGAVDIVVNIPTVEPLPSFMCVPPPNLSNLSYSFGRIWGSVKKVLYYSEPYRPGWFNLSGNRFEFDSDITLIARVPTGLFVGMKNKTIFLAGTEPDKMAQSYAGSGSIPGTLAYCNNVPYLADILGTAEKVFMDVPIWRTTEGIVVGNQIGRLFNITKNNLKMSVPERGASMYRDANGMFQFLTSAVQGGAGSGLGSLDADTNEIFKNQLIALANKYLGATSSCAGFSEEVTCTQTRNGVPI